MWHLEKSRRKNHLALASIVWVESITFQTQLCQCASVLTYNISCSSRAGAVSGIASPDTFYGGFVLCTSGDQSETSRLILLHDLRFWIQVCRSERLVCISSLKIWAHSPAGLSWPPANLLIWWEIGLFGSNSDLMCPGVTYMGFVKSVSVIWFKL